MTPYPSLALVIGVTAGLMACSPTEGAAADANRVDTTAVADAGASADTDRAMDAPVAPEVADVADSGGTDAVGDGSFAADGQDVQGLDADTFEVELPPPPPPVFDNAPQWFYQTKIEGIELDADGESEQLKITLPDGTSSVFVLLESDDDFHFLNLKTVVTPKPELESIIVGAGNGTCIPCRNRVSAGQKVGSFLIPNDPAITSVKGGQWRFTIRGTTIIKTVFETTYPVWPGFVDMTVLARTEPIPDKGRLVLHLHFTGAGDLTASEAPTDPRLQEALIQVAAIFGGAGIEVEVAGYHDVPGTAEDPTLLNLESTLGAPNDLGKLLLTGQSDDTAALNVFFVESIYKDDDFSGGGIVLGIAAGIPGPAFLGPNYRGGVAIASIDFMSDNDYWGNVIAHEIGHFLGLYHSTEKSGAVHDTLDDTDNDDPKNLMYWAYSPEQLVISEDQATVMRSHPLVLPIAP